MHNTVSTLINSNLTYEGICFDHHCLNNLGSLGCTIYLDRLSLLSLEIHSLFVCFCAIVFFLLENPTCIEKMSTVFEIGGFCLMLLIFGWIINTIYSRFNDAKSSNKELDIKKSLMREEQLRKVRGVVNFDTVEAKIFVGI